MLKNTLEIWKYIKIEFLQCNNCNIFYVLQIYKMIEHNKIEENSEMLNIQSSSFTQLNKLTLRTSFLSFDNCLNFKN